MGRVSVDCDSGDLLGVDVSFALRANQSCARASPAFDQHYRLSHPSRLRTKMGARLSDFRGCRSDWAALFALRLCVEKALRRVKLRRCNSHNTTDARGVVDLLFSCQQITTMKTKLISLALLIATLGFTGCNTTTASNPSVVKLAAVDVTARQLLGGKIGTQIATAGEPTDIRDTDKKSRIVTVDQRAYRSWKKANRS